MLARVVDFVQRKQAHQSHSGWRPVRVLIINDPKRAHDCDEERGEQAAQHYSEFVSAVKFPDY